ncbi:MAG: DUF58 domain-containing protein [Pseudohongiella sp.]|uniref:DUF58 domain-containing protein n=1 Tax=Pseudohongiella sp. TaxID=1979412 RepID=UPI00349FE224
MDTGIRQRAAGLRQRWQQLFSQALAKRQARWLDRRVPPATSLQLGQKTIFILPTFQGALFALGAIVVMIIAIAERNPVSLFLSSLLLSLFLLSLVLCYRNLSGLRLQAAHVDPVSPAQRCFVGDSATFTLTIQAAGKHRRHQDLWLGLAADALQPVSVLPGAVTTVALTSAAVQRGLMSAPRLILRTRYPAGLWQAWSRPDLAMRALVYPQPQICALPAAALRTSANAVGQQLAGRNSGVDDFVGLRNYQAGDRQRHIAWHSLARGQGIKTKQFAREAEPEILLSFDQFPGREPEAVLSCLCFQVLQLSRHGLRVGLQLAGGESRDTTFKPGQGDAHKHTLLRALALWT